MASPAALDERIQQSRTRACWICGTLALDEQGHPIEPLADGSTLQHVAHHRCTPLADLARRSVYQAVGEKLGPNRSPKLHVRTGGPSTLFLCKNTNRGMRRVGSVQQFGGVLAFSSRPDACAVCARELAAQVSHVKRRFA